MLLTHFHYLQGKKWKPGLYLQQVESIVTLNPQFYCPQIDKKAPFGKMNCQMLFL